MISFRGSVCIEIYLWHLRARALADERKVPYEKVATIYRRIRLILESKLRYIEAGGFFIAEMEVKSARVLRNRFVSMPHQ